MELLNGSEARVLQALLAAGDESERERLRRLLLPRSTFHVARRKIYAHRWVRDVYVPDPRALGFPYVTVAVAQPHAEEWSRLGTSWAGIGTVPLVWASPTSTFAMGFHADAESARAAAQRLERSEARETFVVTTTAEPSSLPVFFDFEGGWAKYAELPGLFGYPRGLGASERPFRSAGAPASAHERETMRALLAEANVANGEGRPYPNSSPLLFPRPVQRMLREERVQHRLLPQFGRLPPLRSGPIGQVVQFHGELVPGRTAPELLSSMVADCQVYPFFFAHDRRRVVFLALARATGRSPAPADRPDGVAPRPIMSVLPLYLRRIAFVREWLEQIQAPVDHEYDRLLGPAPSSGVALPGAGALLARRLGLAHRTP